MNEENLQRLVKLHKYNFKLIAQDLRVTEEQARKAWTAIYSMQKGKVLPATPAKPLKSPLKSQIQEVKASELLATTRKNANFLNHTDVDFTIQRSISFTGEEITPSGYCVLKHSLKDTFKLMQDRVKEYLPDIEGDEVDGDSEEYMDFKVGIQGNQAVFQTKFKESDQEWAPNCPSVPLPNFDDIHVIPESDLPKPKNQNFIENSKIVENQQKMKKVIFKGREIMMAVEDSQDESEESPWQEFVCVLKPCDKSLIIRALLKMIYKSGVLIKKAYLAELGKEDIGRLYENELSYGKGINFREYVRCFTGKAFVMHLHGENSLDVFSKVIGNINPATASPESFRAKFGETIENNKVYISKNLQHAEEDICKLFDSYKTIYTPPHNNIFEQICLVAQINYLEDSFFTEIFEKFHQGNLQVICFKYDQITQETLDEYCKVGSREIFYNEFGENLVVIGLEGEEIYSKLSMLQEFDHTYISKNPEDAVKELFILINK